MYCRYAPNLPFSHFVALNLSDGQRLSNPDRKSAWTRSLSWLKKAAKGLITRRQAAAERKISERHVYRLLSTLKERKDKSVIHGLRVQASNRRIYAEPEQRAIVVWVDGTTLRHTMAA